MLETDLIADMKQSEYVIVELERLDQGVMEYFEDNFPENQASVANPELYISTHYIMKTDNLSHRTNDLLRYLHS